MTTKLNFQQPVRVQSLRSSLFMVLWQSPDTPFLSCFLSCFMLCFMLERGVWIPALLSCFRPSSGFVSGFGHSYPRFGTAVGACGLEFARAVCSSVRVHTLSSFCFLLFCLVLCGTQLVFFTGCMLSCLSCFVWTLGLWVSLLAVCSCPVLHMANYSVLLAMCLCFCFVWAHGFCHSFCVPSAMCYHFNCLDPTHLVSLLLVNLPHLYSIVTLLISSLFNLSCVCSPVRDRRQMWSVPGVLPSLASLGFPLWGSFFWGRKLLLIKPYLLLQVSPCSHPLHPPWHSRNSRSSVSYDP